MVSSLEELLAYAEARFNPNHDEHGRFAESASASDSDSAGDPAGSPMYRGISSGVFHAIANGDVATLLNSDLGSGQWWTNYKEAAQSYAGRGGVVITAAHPGARSVVAEHGGESGGQEFSLKQGEPITVHSVTIGNREVLSEPQSVRVGGTEARFNPNHDELGRFSESDSSAGPQEDVSGKDVYDVVRKSGGITIDLEGNQPAEGYAYAPAKDTELPIPKDAMTPEDIDKYIDDHYELLSQEGNHLGLWTEGDSVYLDVSRVGAPSAATIAEAQGAQQLAVFDLKTFATINVGTIDNQGGYRTLDEAANIHSEHQRQDEGAAQGRSARGLSALSRRAARRPGVMPRWATTMSAEALTDWVESRYNENHDELGRFAESDSSGGGSGAHDGKGAVPAAQPQRLPTGAPVPGFGPIGVGKTPGKLTEDDINAMADVIEARWNMCDEATREAGAAWYPDAGAWLAQVGEANGFTPEQSAAIGAAFSPLTRWDPDNTTEAMTFMQNYGKTDDPNVGVRLIGPAGGANLQAALRIAGNPEHPLDELHGPKVSSFARNLLGDSDRVTVDTWAARIAFNTEDTKSARNLIGGSGYDKTAQAYRIAAQRAGVSPSTMQAATWMHISNNGHVEYPTP